VLPDLSQLPPEAQQQIQQIEQQAQQQLKQLQETVTVEKVAALLKDQKVRPFTLDIETDSTIEPDQMAEKQHRVEFAGAMGPMLQQIMAAMQMGGSATESLGKFSAEILRYMAGGFKVDRRMDDAIDMLAEQLAQYEPPPEPAQQGEDPQAAQMTAQAEMVTAQAKATEAQASADESKAASQNAQQEMTLRMQEARDQHELDMEKVRLTNAQTQKTLADMHATVTGMQNEQMRLKADVGRIRADTVRADSQAKADMQNADREFRHGQTQDAMENKRADKLADAKAKPDGN
jgi:hypothetical protein